MRAELHAFASELGISAASIQARGLSECAEASELEMVELGDDGKAHFLVPLAAQAWRSLKAAALADNIQLFIVSAFRSVERQAELVRRKLAAGRPIDEILSACARRGSANITRVVPWTYRHPVLLRLNPSSTKQPPSPG